jgi:hypothetical protein
MVVMMATVKLEHGLPTLEVVTDDQAGRLELSQYPIHRRQSDLFTRVEQQAIDIFGRKMVGLRIGGLEYLKDLHARQRDL